MKRLLALVLVIVFALALAGPAVALDRQHVQTQDSWAYDGDDDMWSDGMHAFSDLALAIWWTFGGSYWLKW